MTRKNLTLLHDKNNLSEPNLTCHVKRFVPEMTHIFGCLKISSLLERKRKKERRKERHKGHCRYLTNF